jgi:hypothetical protein
MSDATPPTLALPDLAALQATFLTEVLPRVEAHGVVFQEKWHIGEGRRRSPPRW